MLSNGYYTEQTEVARALPVPWHHGGRADARCFEELAVFGVVGTLSMRGTAGPLRGTARRSIVRKRRHGVERTMRLTDTRKMGE